MKEQSKNTIGWGTDLEGQLSSMDVYGTKLSLDTLKHLSEMAVAVKYCGEVMHLTELLFMTSISEDTFNKRIKELERELDTELARKSK